MAEVVKLKAAKDRAGLPAHEHVFRQLKHMILFGRLEPGQAVTIQGLVDELDAGMTPVREAIRRMTAAGALDAMGNRRIVVPEMNADSLEQLGIVRFAIEPELAARGTLRISTQDIDDMRKIDDNLDQSIKRGDIQGYLENNYAFHQVLNQAAQSPILADVVENSWLRFGPSLRAVCGQYGTRNVPDQHKELLTALEEKNPEAARDAMLGDVRQGMELLALTL